MEAKVKSQLNYFIIENVLIDVSRKKHCFDEINSHVRIKRMIDRILVSEDTEDYIIGLNIYKYKEVA